MSLHPAKEYPKLSELANEFDKCNFFQKLIEKRSLKSEKNELEKNFAVLIKMPGKINKIIDFIESVSRGMELPIVLLLSQGQ